MRMLVATFKQTKDTRFKLKDQATWEQVYGKDNAMRVVYRNGRLTEFDNLATIRNLARA